MIRMIQISSSANAQAYFSEALSRSDYYLDDQELTGRIEGKLAQRLGIKGNATKETFFALCENLDPQTGKPLTPRTKENRIVGYDINFHCPKSVSVLHALSKDNHILEAFQNALDQTMADIERDAKTRVRTKGRDEDRDTDELVWGKFVHQTARAVKGEAPDPHLHAHMIVFNSTYDAVEQRIKAARFKYIMRDLPMYKNMFHKRLSDRLVFLGYDVERTKNSFEVKGVPKKVIQHFSKRTDEIGRIAQEKGITNPKGLDQLGARSRIKKKRGMTMSELKAEWRRQIRALGPDKDGDGNKNIRFAPDREAQRYTAKDCVNHALAHEFERASVKQDRRLLAAAYHHAIGDRSTSIEEINHEFGHDKRIIRVKDGSQQLCTTREVLAEEHRMIKLARQQQGKMLPLYKKLPKMTLEGDQANAVKHVLTTTDGVSIIRGAAGTGKTTLMKEAISLIEHTGKKVITVAPTAKAARDVLRGDGFKEAQTVTKLLQDEKMKASLKGQVLWVDEAGLLGNKEMTSLLELAKQSNARLILGGDTRQHTAVQRGDALRLLNTVGKIKAADVTKIYRQRDEVYRQTVEYFSEGKIREAFSNLEKMNAIEEVDPEKPHEKIADDYVSSKQKGKTGLVISPTHEHGELVTKAIREKLKTVGLISKKDRSLRRLANLNLTEEQKSDWRNIKENHIIQFNQHTPGIKRGSQWRVVQSSEKDVVLTNEKKELVSLPRHRARNYDILSEQTIDLAKGDTIRITRSGFDKDKKSIDNGQMFQVSKIHKNGDMDVRNTKSKVSHRIDKDFGHLSHAHCITSHASQGMTVDEVFIAVPSSTFGATNMKQMYVSVSRGRFAARVYTDDKIELKEHVEKEGDRQTATELLALRDMNDPVRHQIREQTIRNEIARTEPSPKTVEHTKRKERSYEPGI